MIVRRTIKELATLYELEPTLKDVFVEGATDRAFVHSLLRHAGFSQVQVYEIDNIDVPSDLLKRLKIGNGNRDRVIGLAIELEQLCEVDLSRRVCCIADADEEAGKTPRIRATLLLYTDFTSMQMYSFSDVPLQRYFDQVVLDFPLKAATVLSSMAPMLRCASVSRRANELMGLGRSPVDLTDDCQVSGSAIAFDRDRFIQRFLNKANAFHRRNEYLAECQRIDAGLPSQPTLWVHEEDFLDLLHWMIVRLRTSTRTVARQLLGKTLLLAVPFTDALSQPLFVELRRRLT